MYVRYLHKIFTLSVFDTVQECIYNIYKASFSPGAVQQIMPRPRIAFKYTQMTTFDRTYNGLLASDNILAIDN
jgi:hypothetical protein